MAEQQDLIFALDIGTRTIIGLVAEYVENSYRVAASGVVEHEERAMLDGQIHNVREVARQVKKIKEDIENELGIDLKKVGIAAAGRALKTVEKEHKIDFPARKLIEEEDVRTLEMSAVLAAQEELAEDYNFVGYSVIEYKLDDIFLESLVGQRGKSMRAKIVVTFLPRIVIDSLLSVIRRVGLEVEHLTLEPIAAANIVIPRAMANFNLALVDIGAGTSDIALTKGGSMIGYAMVPVAGDEITELLAEEYLLDYNRSEEVKRQLGNSSGIKTKTILGEEIVVDPGEALEIIRPGVENLAALIAERILAINKGAPRAVLCIGGGSLTPFLKERLAEELEMQPDRVGIKDGSDLKKVEGSIKNIAGTQGLTPIGIAVETHKNQDTSIIIELEVNGEPLQLFSINQPTITDALLAADVDIENLRARPGMGLTCTVNGELKTIKGTLGEPGQVLLNGESAALDTELDSGDSIEFTPGKKGRDAEAKIEDILPPEAGKSLTIIINGREVDLSPNIFQNGRLVDLQTTIRDGAEIVYNPLETVRDAAAQVLEIAPEKLTNKMVKFTFNGEEKQLPVSEYIIKEEGEVIDPDSPVSSGEQLEIVENNRQELTVSEVREEGPETISFKFNGSELTIPRNNMVVKANGEEVKSDYKIKPGDNIECYPGRIDVNYVLEFINYNLTPEIKEGVRLLINGSPADFSREIKEGDEIMIKFADSS